MTGLLIFQAIALLIILGVIFLDRKNDNRYKWRRFLVSFFTLIVMQVIFYLAALVFGGIFFKSDGDMKYLLVSIYALSIISTLFISRWYVKNY